MNELDNPEHADPPPPVIKLVFFPDFFVRPA